MKDMLNSVTLKKVIAPISGAGDTTAQVGAIIDHQGYESVTYLLGLGVLSDADATFAVLLEDGDASNLSDAATVADAKMISESAAAPLTAASFQFDDDGKVRTLGYKGQKRYSRLTITPTANTGAWLIAAQCLLGHRRVLPFAQPTT